MGLWELFMIAVGLSMDAFAISISKGLSAWRLERKSMVCTGLWPGGAQVLMPLLDYFPGTGFQSFIGRIDHWIVFFLLLSIGLGLAIADRIDALAAGGTFSFLEIQIVPAVLLMGAITVSLSAAGVKIGSCFGEKYRTKAELADGIILIAMGTEILLEHLRIMG